ncbi:MAG: hypothetical protein M3Q44_08375 [bacterium]|nr:hypothetical protein [bacterium]
MENTLVTLLKDIQSLSTEVILSSEEDEFYFEPHLAYFIKLMESYQNEEDATANKLVNSCHDIL